MTEFSGTLFFSDISRNRRVCMLTIAMLLAITQFGCVSSRAMFAGRGRDRMAGAPRLRNANHPELEDVVTHLNKNTDLIQCWRANNVRIRTGNFTLSGTLAVEKGNHVRLVVSSPMGNEVDLGSNDERFWVWSRRLEPAFVTCKHENMDVARQALGVPFEPEWLMEALGVSPLPTSGVTMQMDNQQARLVQQVVSAHGRPLRRVVLVDLKKGNGIVVEHSLYDYDGKRIALAKLSGHYLDKQTGAVLPTRIMLDWPQNQMQMTMDLGKIQVNPTSIPRQIWAMPELPGYQVVDLDAQLPPTRIAAQSRSGVDLGSIETSPSDTDENEMPRWSDGIRPSVDSAGHSVLSNDADEPDESEATSRADDDWGE
jgi:hypothetical protein